MTDGPRVAPHPDAILRRVGTGAVLVNLGSGHVYELNDSAARAWELAAEGRTASEVAGALEAEYSGAAAEIRRDVHELFAFLANHGLLAP
jgi:hypothetical protein